MEIIAILTAAKDMGIEAGSLSGLVILYFLLRRDLTKIFDKQFDKLIASLTSLEEVHGKRLEVIEKHIGLKKEYEV